MSAKEFIDEVLEDARNIASISVPPIAQGQTAKSYLLDDLRLFLCSAISPRLKKYEKSSKPIRDEVLLQELKELVRAKSDEELNSQWIESTQARQLLGVSQKTWQAYRDRRIIAFTQVGRKIYVKRGDLNKFMQDHYINSK